jgi:hypothetical protein
MDYPNLMLSRRILCHCELTEALRSILRRRDMKRARQALKEIRIIDIIGENEYNALIKLLFT